jgi:ABC-type uncharacterized transport system substrate-binding protein
MRRALALCLALLPHPAAAHPHIFVDTGLTLILDDENRLVAIRVAWAYDELYSLLVLDHLGLDQDYDGVLAPDEIATLAGFDMQWVEGFLGDTYATQDGTDLALGPPEAPGAALEDGQIVTLHTRAVLAPAPADGVSVRAYDPTFYTSYDLTRGVTVEGGSGCATEVAQSDLDAAYTMLEELLYGPRSAEWTEDNFPEVGEAFADTVRLTCASGS